jgi:hypothetical protein
LIKGEALSNHPGRNEPLVFLSFAGPDRPMAEKLGRDLAAQGFDAFIDARSIEPGENILVAINNALTDSSYFVLLWSRHTDRRPWVDLEYTAALARDLNTELNTRRSFFFIVRLDESPVPWILAARKYLDAFANWEGTVAKLTATWNRDRALGPNVFPAPVTTSAGRSRDDSVIELRIRNKALSVSHVMKAPQDVTGPQLYALVAEALALKETAARFGGLVTARFTYELRYDDRALPDRPDQPLTELGLDDGDTVDLLVRGEFESDGKNVGSWTFRDGQPPGGSALSPQIIRSLIDIAFGHLQP